MKLEYRNILVIGDVHGKIDRYLNLIDKFMDTAGVMTIQVGDFGFRSVHDYHLNNLCSQTHKINFGNHDFIPYKDNPHSTGDFHFFENYDIFTIRGARSIDWHYRTEGVDWFRDEELDHQEMENCVAAYEKTKPEIVITHDCPNFLTSYEKDSTRGFLEFLFLEVHKPKKWIFGHHHESHTTVVDGCEFQCLKELEILII